MTFYSDRGMPLILDANTVLPVRVPTLTVEMYCKWYTPFLIMPDGRTAAADISDLENFTPTGESAWGGSTHVWNPSAIKALAEARGWDIDDCAYEMICGRWEIEHRGRY